MNCDQLAILQITDGTTLVDLLDRDSGFLLKEWVPQIAEFKEGGIFQESPLATGRRLVAYRFANVTERMTVSTRHVTADALIHDTQTLRRLLQKAADYWATDWQNTPVYVKARGKGETNTRYCLIQQGRLGIDGNPYAQPFMQPSGSGHAVFDEQLLIFERGDWLSEVPGSTLSVPITSTQEWDVPAWDVETTTPSGDVIAMAQDDDGVLYAGTDDTATLYISTDNGVTWSQFEQFGGAATDVIEGILCVRGDTNKIYVMVSGSASGQGAWYTSNGGSSWSRILSGRDYYTAGQSDYSGWIYIVGDDSAVNIRTLDGVTIQTTTSTAVPYLGIAVNEDNGDILLIRDDEIRRASFQNSGGVIEVNHGSSTFECIIRLSSGRFLAGMANGVVYKSDDGGDNWATVTDTVTSGAYSMTQGLDGLVYAGGAGVIWISRNNGENWTQVDTVPSINVEGMLTKADGEIYAGDAGQILVQAYNNYSATTLHVTNGHPIAEITNVKSYDASAATYTDRFPNPSLPYPLWPIPTAALDFIYIGVNEDADSHTFSSFVINITTVGYMIAPIVYYWDGATWDPLPTSLLRGFGPNGFGSAEGQFAWVWDMPSDWATTTIDGVVARWVRVAAQGTNLISPYQGEYNLYAMRNAYVEVAASAVLGDLPALAQMEIEVSSNENGTSGGEGYINRVIVGLRNVSRGSRFNAYLNASDQGNDSSVLVEVGTDTTFVTDITYPANRRATYSPATTGSWLDIVTWTLAGDLVEDYYGTFHVFLRARQVGGSAGDIQLRMVTSTGSGGIEITTVSKEFENTNDYQFIDFGRVTFPVSSLQNDDEQGDEAAIIIQANASSTTPDVYFTDLVFIPIDEWYGDFTDQVRNATSPVTNRYYLDVDSATYPKRSVRALVRSVEGTNQIKNVFQPSTNGEFILQANARQRLWFFFARTASAGSPNIWYSEPFAAAKITLGANQRYLGMRGDR